MEGPVAGRRLALGRAALSAGPDAPPRPLGGVAGLGPRVEVEVTEKEAVSEGKETADLFSKDGMRLSDFTPRASRRFASAAERP